jgi:phosphatidylinositol glycan class M
MTTRLPIPAPSTCILCGLLLRTVAILAGEYFDRFSDTINYTDVDYYVFSDGAKLLSQGRSPYDRVTFRYPPLVALIILPVKYIPVFGKLLFSFVDVGCANEIHKLLSTAEEIIVRDYSLVVTYVYMCNPCLINICTRGSIDSIPNWLMLLIVRVLSCEKHEQRFVWAGLLFGCVTHLRLYPIIYLPSLLLYILCGEQKLTTLCKRSFLESPMLHRAWRFLASAFISCGALTTLSYYWFGKAYLEHALLYHINRVDYRHNFSIHFYTNYLGLALDDQSLVDYESSLATHGKFTHEMFAFFVPQIFLILLVAWKYKRKPNKDLCHF